MVPDSKQFISVKVRHLQNIILFLIAVDCRIAQPGFTQFQKKKQSKLGGLCADGRISAKYFDRGFYQIPIIFHCVKTEIDPASHMMIPDLFTPMFTYELGVFL